MGKKKANKSIGTKKVFDEQKSTIKDALKICPYEPKICSECEIPDCPEEQE